MEHTPVYKREKTEGEYNPSNISEGYHVTTLERDLHVVSQEVNTVCEHLGLGMLVDDGCRIHLDAYQGVVNFPEKKLKGDADYVERKEAEFIWEGALKKMSQQNGKGIYEKKRTVTEADKEAISYHFYQTYGATTTEEIRAVWHKERAQGLAEGFEMLITALFHKAFGKEFITVRSSAYDDYAHGIDTVIINKKTGELVCAFDELHEFGGDEQHRERSERRSREKRENIERMNKEGGMTLTYGVTKNERGFQRKSIQHVPILCLSLETKELLDALREFTLDGGLSENEEALCRSITTTLIKQAIHMEDVIRSEEERRASEQGMHLPIEGVPVRQHLQHAGHSLARMLEILDVQEGVENTIYPI